MFGPVVEFTFDTPGNYTIDLTVKDDEGNAATGNLTIFVQPKPLYSEQPDESWLVSNSVLIFILVIGIVVAVAVLLDRRNKS